MQYNIIWTGVEYHSIENCLVNINNDGSVTRSVINGLYEGKIYKVEYTIYADREWNTKEVRIYARHSNKEQQVILVSDRKGHWIMNGENAETLKGCIDVDIPVTPFTNTLPVKRLLIEENEEAEISVVYLDMLEWNIRPVKQLYRRISAGIYHYENIPNDFEADISTDENGFVVDYPQLFKRSAIIQSNYQVVVQ